MDLKLAPDIKKRIAFLVRELNLAHIRPTQLICFRSFNSSSRARARIWSFPKIWQLALGLPPYYCIEVLSAHFDHLSGPDQERVLIHELIHIPKNFSGALLPHRNRHRPTHRHYESEVESLFRKLCKYSFE